MHLVVRLQQLYKDPRHPAALDTVFNFHCACRRLDTQWLARDQITSIPDLEVSNVMRAKMQFSNCRACQVFSVHVHHMDRIDILEMKVDRNVVSNVVCCVQGHWCHIERVHMNKQSVLGYNTFHASMHFLLKEHNVRV